MGTVTYCARTPCVQCRLHTHAFFLGVRNVKTLATKSNELSG